MAEVKYLYFGPQCPGRAYMGQGAREAAALLGLPYAEYDVRRYPGMAQTNNMFFPGMIVIGDFSLVYPGSGVQIVESFQRRGPLAGGVDWHPQPMANPDRIEVLTPENIGLVKGVCIPEGQASGWEDKQNWLHNFPLLGFVAHSGGGVVAVLEVLPVNQVPYPLPEVVDLFITCLYGRYDIREDYRPFLVKEACSLLREMGFRTIGVVAGKLSPYPNGPASVFAQAGFIGGAKLGRALLRHRWEELIWMKRELLPRRR